MQWKIFYSNLTDQIKTKKSSSRSQGKNPCQNTYKETPKQTI